MPKDTHVIYSMTGFGRGSAEDKQHRVSVELRSVNGRFLDIRSKIPRYLNSAEISMKDTITQKVRRGVVDMIVNVQAVAGALGVSIDSELAKTLAREVDKLSEAAQIPSGLNAISLLRLPGVVISDALPSKKEENEITKLVLEALAEALDGFIEMRRKEGDKLRKTISKDLEEISVGRSWIAGKQDSIKKSYFTKIEQRVKDWNEKAKSGLDDTRIYQEVAFYVDRSAVDEEVERLESHLKQFADALESPQGKAIGKRLDFISQEIGREINTIGSKTDLSAVTEKVVDMKVALERIREQVQNLE